MSPPHFSRSFRLLLVILLSSTCVDTKKREIFSKWHRKSRAIHNNAWKEELHHFRSSMESKLDNVLQTLQVIDNHLKSVTHITHCNADLSDDVIGNTTATAVTGDVIGYTTATAVTDNSATTTAVTDNSAAATDNSTTVVDQWEAAAYNSTVQNGGSSEELATTVEKEPCWHFTLPAQPERVKINETTRVTDCRNESVTEVENCGVTGIYRLRESGRLVLCEGEWMIIHRRTFPYPISFDRDWSDYRNGFGDLCSDFWLGNELVHEITNSNKYSLKVEITTNSGTKLIANYESFTLDSEEISYKLHVNGYHGNAKDGFQLHNGEPFATADHALCHNSFACAILEGCGWWMTHTEFLDFTTCNHHLLGSNLNNQNADLEDPFRVKTRRVNLCLGNSTWRHPAGKRWEIYKYANAVYWRGKKNFKNIQMKIKMIDFDYDIYGNYDGNYGNYDGNDGN